MKFILTSLLTLLLLFSSSPLPFLAAVTPNASLAVTGNRRFILLKFSNLKTVSKVSYVLTYDTDSGQKGLEGSLTPRRHTNRINRRQILGTCSGRRCVYHPHPRNFTLEVTFTLRSGGTTSLAKTLP